LILITLDTLRADHVGAYGSKRARTPTATSSLISVKTLKKNRICSPRAGPSRRSQN
jgi:hypothetical protein